MTDSEYDRCVAVLESVHLLHNWRHVATSQGIVRDPWNVWVKFSGQLATFDGNELTRLTIAAHTHHVRASLSAKMGYLLLQLSPRQPSGSFFERHPGMEVFRTCEVAP